MSKDPKYIDTTLLESLLEDLHSNLNKLVSYINDPSIGAVRQILAKALARKTHSTIDGSPFQISLTIEEDKRMYGGCAGGSKIGRHHSEINKIKETEND